MVVAALVLAACTSTGHGERSGDAAPTGLPSRGPRCDTCLTEQCFREIAACERESGACLAEYQCRAACEDPRCAAGCATLGQAGRTTALLDGCGQFHCATECAVAPFECAGEWTAPPQQGAVSLSLHVTRTFGGNPIPALDATVCRSASLPCDAVDTGVTDSEGRVDLSVPGEVVYDAVVELRDPSSEFGDHVAQVGAMAGAGVAEFDLVDQYLLQVPPQLAAYLPDETQGLVYGRVIGCDAKRVEGVEVSSPSTDRVSAIQAVAATLLEKTDRDARFVAASSGGAVEIVANHSEREIARERVLVRPGWIHWLLLAPMSAGGQ
jgi:hypothetical protein